MSRIAPLAGPGGVQTTNGVLTISPTRQLFIGNGLTLTNPNPGEARLDVVPSSSIYMPQIKLEFQGSFPVHSNLVKFNVDDTANLYDHTVYDFVTGDNDSLRIISKGIYLVEGVLLWDNSLSPFADFNMTVGLGGTGAVGYFDLGFNGTRTQTGITEGITSPAETNYKSCMGVVVVDKASSSSNFVSIRPLVRNETGSPVTSTFLCYVLRLSTNPLGPP